MPYEPGTVWQYEVPTTSSTHLPPDAGYGKALTNQGYGFEVAVADLIDNSIDAGADKIVVHFLRDAKRILTLLVIDNGKGMDDADLDAAMTVGRRRDYGESALNGSKYASEKLGLTIQATASFFASFVVAFAVQWKLTLITLGIVPAILIITGICMGYDAGYETQIMAIHARGGRLAEEAFSSVKNVQAFWAYPKLSRKYRAILDEAGAIGSKKSPIYAGFFAAEWFCVLCGYALAFWQGVRMYSTGEIANPGDVVTYGPSYLLALTHIC